MLSINAQTTWIGGDGNWDDNSMWDNGVPDATDDVGIPSGVTVTITGMVLAEAKSIYLQGNLIVDNGGELLLDGAGINALYLDGGILDNAGSIVIQNSIGDALLNLIGSVTNSGSMVITNIGGNGINNLIGTILNNSSIEISNITDLGLNNESDFTNNGSMELGSGTSNSTSSTFTNNGGLVNNGTLTNTSTFTNNGTYAGVGEFVGNFDNTSNGIVSPGSTLGTALGCMTITGDFSNDGTVNIDVDGTTSACTDFDQLIITGAASLDGTLQANITNTPSASTEFAIVDAGSGMLLNNFSVMLPSNWSMSSDLSNGDVKLAYQLPLPVEMVRFKAEVVDKSSVLLIWQTATELNNEGFYIEQSRNSIEWRELGFVKGHGTSLEQLAYSFIDQSPASGVNYYRLRQIDMDGQAEFSSIVSANVPFEHGSFELYPNPASSHLTLNFGEGNEKSEAAISLYDTIGKKVKESFVKLEGYSSQVEIDVSNLPKGIYILMVKATNQTWEEKLIIK